MAPALEVLTVGRISVDLYADELGVGWNSVSHFVVAVGGTATNVAIAATRLGHHAAVFTKVGQDPQGEYVRHRLGELGVDTTYVGVSPGLHTPLAFAVLDPPEDPPLVFYRDPIAPDLTIETTDIDLDVVDDVPVFWITGTGVSTEPSASTILTLCAHRGRRAHTVVDLDYRAMLWASEDDARRAIPQLLDFATVVVGNRTECDIAVSTTDPDTAADRLLARGVSLAIVKMGGDGVLVATPDTRVKVPPFPIQVYCGLGAGDAFGGALVHGLLRGWDPSRIGLFANAAGALVASRLLCSDAMGTEEEILTLMERDHATL